MFQLNSISHYRDLAYDYVVSISQNNIIKRIGEFVSAVFSYLSSFFSSLDRPSQEMNLKPMAMISVILLISLFIFAVCRKRADPPSSPASKV